MGKREEGRYSTSGGWKAHFGVAGSLQAGTKWIIVSREERLQEDQLLVATKAADIASRKWTGSTEEIVEVETILRHLKSL